VKKSASRFIGFYGYLFYSALLFMPMRPCIAEDPKEDPFADEITQITSLRDQGKIDAAIPLAERLTQEFIRLHGEMSNNVAFAYVLEGDLRAKAKDIDKATDRYRKVLAILKQPGAKSSGHAHALDTIGFFFRKNNQLKDAIESAQLSIDMQRTFEQRDDLLFASALLTLALSHLDNDDRARAVPVMEELIGVEEKRSGPDSSRLAGFLGPLALAHHKLNHLEAARRHYERALSIYSRQHFFLRDSVSLSLARTGLADVLFDMGRYREAESLYRKELAACEGLLGSKEDTISPCRKIAQCLVFRDRLGQAEQFALRATKTAEKVYGAESELTAASLDTLASVYRLQGKWDDAQALFEKAIKLSEEKHGPSHRETATGLLNLAVLHADREDFQQAATTTERVLKIYKAQKPQDAMDIAAASTNLGLAYWALGRHQDAQPLLDAAAESCTATVGANNMSSIAMEHARAQNLYFLGQNEDVQRIVSDCLARIEDTFGGDHIFALSPRVTLAVNHVVVSDRATAGIAFDKALRSLVAYVGKYLAGLSASEQRAVLQAGPSRPYHASLAFALTNPDDTQTAELSAAWLANMKALGHEALASSTLLQRQSPDPDQQKKLGALADVRQQLASLSQLVPTKAEQARHQEECRRLEKAEGDLVHAIGGQVAELYEYKGWTEVKDIQARLPKQAVLIDFARVRPFDFHAKSWPAAWQAERYAAWLIPAAGSGRVGVVDLGPADAIDRLIAEYRKELHSALGQQGAVATLGEKRAEQNARLKGEALAKAVFAPIATAMRERCGIAEARTLVVCPDSDLWLIPWGALPVDDTRYLIEDYAVLTVTSGRQIARDRDSANSQTAAVVFADPDFDSVARTAATSEAATKAVLEQDKDDVKHARRIPRASRLPATRAEATLLQPVLASLTKTKPVALIGPDATESAVKDLHGPRIAHFATHGFFLADPRMASKGADLAAMSTAGSRGASSLLNATGEQLRSPFLRSGLLLAGCNSETADVMTAGDDGVLTAAEVLGIDLIGTELAVLSACETAIGDIHCGEGVAGLRQAFLIAGAQSVLASLWHVDDAATADLMTGFFERLDGNAAEALALAQRAALEERRRSRGAAHPVYWGAFELTQ
jgi:CHAT domain-containing protein